MKYVLFIMLLIIGCSVNQSEQVSLNGSCDRFLEDKHLTWNVHLQPGDSLLVTLCSNATTGFQWSESVQIKDQSILEQMSHTFTPPEKSITGAAGKEEWTLNTHKKGSSIGVWEYSRPWAGGEKGEWSVTATVIVD